MSYLKLSKFLLAISVLLMIASAVLLVTPGPRLSIEFTGGTLMELALPAGKTQDDLDKAVRGFRTENPLTPSLAKTRTETYFVRLSTLTNEEHQALFAHLEKTLGDIDELQYTTIGPTVGSSLKRNSAIALGAALVAIILYLAFAFRKMPRALSPWTFGYATIAALIHDTLIMMGIFTILSHYTTFQFDTLFATALLSIMGYSVSDTIVIFDRIRDNAIAEPRADFAELTERSLRQSISRTLTTGMGALIMLFALFFFGSESIRWFVFALIAGTLIGTYSSFFVATPLVVLWKNARMKK